MGQASFVLAIDGGGSKTEAQLLDSDGRALAGGRAGPANLFRDADAALAALDGAWRQCCASAGLDPEADARRTALSAALAGAGAPAGRARFFAAGQRFRAAHLSGDAYAALLGAFDGAPGILLVAGTGSVACRLDRDGFEQRGGWGFPAGDLGSGAWIGLQLAGAWLRHRDGIDPTPDPLWPRLAAQIGDDRETILRWHRAAGPAEFAALTRHAEGSPAAETVLEAAATHCADLLRTLARPGLAIALVGGLANTLAPRLATRLPGVTDRRGDPLRGAFLIAAGRAIPEFQETR